MQQAESQFTGRHDLDRYSMETGRMGEAAQRGLAQYGMQLPYDYQDAMRMQEDPWRRYGAKYGREQDLYGKQRDVAGMGLQAAGAGAGMGMQHAGTMGGYYQDLGMGAYNRARQPWEFTKDVLNTGLQVGGLAAGMGWNPFGGGSGGGMGGPGGYTGAMGQYGLGGPQYYGMSPMAMYGY